jgi:putative tricarboxylic transport membrane protein
MTRNGAATGRRPDGAAFIIALVLVALGALLIWDGGAIPNKGGYSGVGPGDVPKLIGSALFCLALGPRLEGCARIPDLGLPRSSRCRCCGSLAG